jgi:Cdc6-like AAA superfamily ATPase
MKKATDIYSFADNLNPTEPLKLSDKEFYVPIYDTILKKLRDKVINEKVSSQTFFITGQVGSGKTTALNFFADEEINKKFTVKIIQGRDIFNPDDIDIVDILLTFGYELVKGKKNLEHKYFKKLDTIQKIKEGDTEIEEVQSNSQKAEIGTEAHASAGINFFNFINLGAKIFSSIKADSANRKIIRKIFQFKMKDIFDLLNEIIDDYHASENNGKKLVVILDDLEKIRNPEQIKSIFVDNKFYLSGLKCIKLIAIPVNLISESSIFTTDAGVNIYPFNLIVLENPADNSTNNSEEILKNNNLLKEIIYKKIEGDYKEIISPPALDLALKNSGGLLRQFIQILYNAAAIVRVAKAKCISENDIERACHEMQSLMSRSIISTDKIKLLNKINENKIPCSDDSESKIFIEALLSTQIIVYQNGTPWYEVNPLIKKTVVIYGKKFNSA